MTQSCLRTYLKAIQENVSNGNYTEHTHRPAMKALLECMTTGITATNEPGRVACGAPDFSVTEPQNGQTGACGGFGGMLRLSFQCLGG